MAQSRDGVLRIFFLKKGRNEAAPDQGADRLESRRTGEAEAVNGMPALGERTKH